MSRPVVVLKPEEDDRIAAEVMRKKRIKRLPIAKNGKFLGIEDDRLQGEQFGL